MSFLLDTNVLSELRRERPASHVAQWARASSRQAKFVSVITLGEIRLGVESARARELPNAAKLDSWLTSIAHEFGDRVVPVDAPIADRWGRLVGQLRATPIATSDALIAATALVHDWTLVTRNVKDFERTGARLLNPFEPR